MKRKVVTGRTQPSSEEVNSLQNFDGIIDGVANVRRGRTIKISLGAVAAAVVAIVVSLWPAKNIDNQPISDLGGNAVAQVENSQPHDDLDALYPIPVENFDIDPSVDNLIVTSNGTLIDVPSGSFSNEKNVTLEFKDLSDPMTVFASQISMDYDSLGTKYHFQSGGMFELTATSGSATASLVDNAAIQVSYPTITADDGMNQYRYNVETQDWKYDSTMPLDQLEGACETHQVDFTNQHTSQNTPPAMANFQSEVDAILGGVPDEPELASATRYKFNFDFDEADFPELTGFADVMFQAKDSRFKRSFYEKSWDSVELKKGKLGYSIVLKDGSIEEQFNVMPVLQKEAYETAFAKYEQAKSDAEAKVDKLAEAQTAHEDWINDVRSRKSEYTFVSRDKAKVITNFLVADLDQKTLYRTFNLPSLGVVNCDKAFQFPKGTGIQADFVGNTDDGLIRFAQVQLIEMDSPSYATYQMGEYQDFRYRKGKQNLILAVNHEGRIAVGLPNMLKGLKVEKGETHQFELQWMEGSFKSLDDLKAELKTLTTDYDL